MKKAFLLKTTVLLFMAFACNGFGQDLLEKLVGKTWYVNGKYLEHDEPMTFELKLFDTPNKTKATLFSNNLIVFNFMIGPDSTGSATGLNMNFACYYKLKKDVIKMYYVVNTPKEALEKQELIFYYFVKEHSPITFEFLPASALDFK